MQKRFDLIWRIVLAVAIFLALIAVALPVFAAGTLDLKVDGKDDPNVPSYFRIDDVKPCDWGSEEITLSNVGCVDGIAGIQIVNPTTDENGLTWPEIVLGDPGQPGELHQALEMRFRADLDGDGTYEELVAEGKLYDIADTNFVFGDLPAYSTVGLMIEWWVDCHVGNIIQSDRVTFDIEFSLNQKGSEPDNRGIRYFSDYEHSYDNYFAAAVSPDITPPTVDNFEADEETIVLGETVRFYYSVSDTGGSELKQVELWEATDTDGDGQPNWPPNPTDYVDMHSLSGNSASGHFDYEPQELGTHWYGIHVVDNAGYWNDERNSHTGGSPGVFGPLQVDVVGITVVQPNGGEKWAVGSNENIMWTSFGVAGDVDIFLSRDGGSSWENIASGVANDGDETWTVTGPPTSQASIKIASVSDPSTYDVSDGSFSIVIPPAQQGPTIRSFSPKSGCSGTKVTIVGTNFVKGHTTVVFRNITIKADDRDILSCSRNRIVVRVPNAPETAISGRITVKTSKGTVVSTDSFVAEVPDVPWATQIGVHNGIPAYSNGGWWSGRYDDKGNEMIGDYGWEYQCVEYVNRYYAIALGHENMKKYGGHAKSYYYEADKKGLKAFPDGGEEAPKKDDILIFYDEEHPENNPYGHVAIIKNVYPEKNGKLKIDIIQQNVLKNWRKPGCGYIATATLDVTEKPEDGKTIYDVSNVGSGLKTPVVGWSRIPENP